MLGLHSWKFFHVGGLLQLNLGLMTNRSGNKVPEFDEINEAVEATKRKMMQTYPQIYLYLCKLRVDVSTWCASCLHRFLDISVAWHFNSPCCHAWCTFAESVLNLLEHSGLRDRALELGHKLQSDSVAKYPASS